MSQSPFPSASTANVARRSTATGGAGRASVGSATATGSQTAGSSRSGYALPGSTLTTNVRREAFAAHANAATAAQAARRTYIRTLVAVDLAVITLSVWVGYLARFQGESTGTNIPYAPLGLGVIALWMFVVARSRSYDDQILGYGPDEYRRVISASLKVAGGLAIAAYLADVQVSRGFLGIALLTGTLFLPVGRYAARKMLHRSRSHDRGWSRRVLAVGDASHVIELTNQLRREWYAGYKVVGACIPDALVAPVPQQLDGVPVVGSFRNILDAAAAVSADTVAITGSTELTARRLRRLGWQMEGTGIDLVLAPALTDVAGPRIHTRPVAGLPLIHVESPEFTGGRKALKGFVDRSLAAMALFFLLPAFIVIATAIKLDSRGPAFYKQTRVGRGGREFEVFKFRSMVTDADSMLHRLGEQNETDGLMFKMKRDPRVTRVGAFLRTWSLDELPQLINVLIGDMSLVGPRPPLPTEVAWYDQDVARRLLVKPGMTGLW